MRVALDTERKPKPFERLDSLAALCKAERGQSRPQFSLTLPGSVICDQLPHFRSLLCSHSTYGSSALNRSRVVVSTTCSLWNAGSNVALAHARSASVTLCPLSKTTLGRRCATKGRKSESESTGLSLIERWRSCGAIPESSESCLKVARPLLLKRSVLRLGKDRRLLGGDQFSLCESRG